MSRWWWIVLSSLWIEYLITALCHTALHKVRMIHQAWELLVYEIHCSRQVYFLKFKRQSNSQGLFGNQCGSLLGRNLSGKELRIHLLYRRLYRDAGYDLNTAHQRLLFWLCLFECQLIFKNQNYIINHNGITSWLRRCYVHRTWACIIRGTSPVEGILFIHADM